MNVKKIALIIMGFLLYPLSFILHPPIVFAHVLKTDREIGAVVHIDPEDDPIVGEQTTIYFDIKDTTNRFKAENCDCRFIVKKAGAIVNEQIMQGTTVQYDFPEKNVYTIELNGSPKTANAFQPFTLSYDLRVEREKDLTIQNTESSKNNFILDHIPHIAIIGLVLLICAYVIYQEKKKK